MSVRARLQLKASESIVQLRKEAQTSAPPVQRLCHAVNFIAKSAHARGVLHVLTVPEVADNCHFGDSVCFARTPIPSTGFKFCPLNLGSLASSPIPRRGNSAVFRAIAVRGCESHVVSCLVTETFASERVGGISSTRGATSRLWTVRLPPASLLEPVADSLQNLVFQLCSQRTAWSPPRGSLISPMLQVAANRRVSFARPPHQRVE